MNRARLQRLVHIRSVLNDVQRGHLASAQKSLSDAMSEEMQAQENLREQERALNLIGEQSAERLAHLADMVRLSTATVQAAAERRAEDARAVEQARLAVRETHRELRVMETLEQKQREQMRLEGLRREQRMMDEVAARRRADHED